MTATAPVDAASQTLTVQDYHVIYCICTKKSHFPNVLRRVFPQIQLTQHGIPYLRTFSTLTLPEQLHSVWFDLPRHAIADDIAFTSGMSNLLRALRERRTPLYLITSPSRIAPATNGTSHVPASWTKFEEDHDIDWAVQCSCMYADRSLHDVHLKTGVYAQHYPGSLPYCACSVWQHPIMRRKRLAELFIRFASYVAAAVGKPPLPGATISSSLSGHTANVGAIGVHRNPKPLCHKTTRQLLVHGSSRTQAAVAQRLPDSPDCLISRNQVLDHTSNHSPDLHMGKHSSDSFHLASAATEGHLSNSSSKNVRLAFPTDSRERRKAREKEAKEKGETILVKKKQFRVEDHFDDCGEDVSQLERELRSATAPTDADPSNLFTDELRLHPDYLYLTKFCSTCSESSYCEPLMFTLFGNSIVVPSPHSAYFTDTNVFYTQVCEMQPTFVELRGGEDLSWLVTAII